MDKPKHVVAVVDDDLPVRRALERLVRSLSYRPAGYASGDAFLASLDEEVPFCVVLDQHMPGLNGLEVLIRMRAQGADAPVIVVTGTDQPGMAEKFIDAGAYVYLTKPVGRAAIREAIQAATAG
jgi:FixJ family two-component response regulator